MVNRVVPRAELAEATFALADVIATMPPFGLALAKRAVNQCEDLMGMRPGMDSVFGLHHLAHAHNAEVSGDSLAGLDARGMKNSADEKDRRVTGEPPVPARSGPRCGTGCARTCPPGRCRRWTPPKGSPGTVPGSASCAAARLSVVSWPPRYGGRGASLLEWLVFEEEYHAAAAPVRVGQNGLFLLAPTLMRHGTAEQRDRLLPPMARADEVWAQAWSEPEAGSDLAAVRASAVRVNAAGPRGAGCCRGPRPGARVRRSPTRRSGCSGPVPERAHDGLTYLLFGLRADGVTVRPIRQLGGEAGFAEIFLDGVFVPDADVVGAPGDGWRIAMSTAGDERGLSLRSPGRFSAAAARLVELWRRAGGPDADSLRDRVVDAWIGARAYRLHTFATAARLAAGGTLGAEASLGKVFWSELDVALHETALDLLGPRAELRGRRGGTLAGRLPVLAGRPDLRGHERDPADGDRRAAAGTAPMRQRR